MTVEEYLNKTIVKNIRFLVGINKFEEIHSMRKAHGGYTYSIEILKYLDKQVVRAFIDSKGVLTIDAL